MMVGNVILANGRERIRGKAMWLGGHTAVQVGRVNHSNLSSHHCVVRDIHCDGSKLNHMQNSCSYISKCLSISGPAISPAPGGQLHAPRALDGTLLGIHNTHYPRYVCTYSVHTY